MLMRETSYVAPSPLYRSKRFYECGCCGAMHNDAWLGDCRQDNARFTVEEIEAAHGNAWEEVPMSDDEAEAA